MIYWVILGGCHVTIHTIHYYNIYIYNLIYIYTYDVCTIHFNIFNTSSTNQPSITSASAWHLQSHHSYKYTSPTIPTAGWFSLNFSSDPAPPGMYETLKIMGKNYQPQLVSLPDFSHQQHLSILPREWVNCSPTWMKGIIPYLSLARIMYLITI